MGINRFQRIPELIGVAKIADRINPGVERPFPPPFNALAELEAGQGTSDAKHRNK